MCYERGTRFGLGGLVPIWRRSKRVSPSLYEVRRDLSLFRYKIMSHSIIACVLVQGLLRGRAIRPVQGLEPAERQRIGMLRMLTNYLAV